METLRPLDIYGSHLHQKVGVGGFLRLNMGGFAGKELRSGEKRERDKTEEINNV